MFPDKDFQPLVESTVVDFAVVFHLPETVSGDSPTVNIVIIIDEKKPSTLHEYNPELCHRWQSVAWKPITNFGVTTLDDVKADTKQTRKRKSSWPCDACGMHARFARDEIINLAAGRFARNESLHHSTDQPTDQPGVLPITL